MNYIAGGLGGERGIGFQTGFPLQITQSTNFNSGFGYASQRPNATGVSPVTSGSLEARLEQLHQSGGLLTRAAIHFRQYKPDH